MEILTYPFFQRALLGTVLLSIALAIIGVYIMSRRMVFISGGITHACFGGLGLGYYLGISPIISAAIFAVAGSMGVEWLSQRRRVRSDSAIAVVWAMGMALGILFIFLSEGYVPELNAYLFGNVLTVSNSDLWAFGIFTALLVAFFVALERTIMMVAFDPSFARVNGVPVKLIDYTMTIFVAVAIVLSIRLIGIMMLMSLISLPQMIAETWTRRYRSMMLLSIAVSLVGCVGGLFAAYCLSVPASATIVLLLGALFLLTRLRP